MNKPIWEPSAERIERANLNRFMRFAREQTGNDDLRRFAPLYDFSVRYPERFWPLVWEFCGIRASGSFHEVLVDAERMPGAKWFPGVRLNVAQNLLRLRDDRCALMWRDSAGEWQELSYFELQQQVARLAQSLRALGVQAGAHVAAVLPNSPEAVVAMLASSAVGAVWMATSTTTDSDAMAALHAFAPTLVFVGDASQAQALDNAGALQHVVVLDDTTPASSGTTRTWAALLDGDAQVPSFELTAFDHPLYALHQHGRGTSVHPAGGTLIQHLKELVLHADLKREDRVLYNAQPGQPIWYWLMSALATGCTLVFAADALALAQSDSWDAVDERGITVLVAAAAQFQALREADLRPAESHKLLNLKTILASGAALDAATVTHIYQAVKQRLMVSSLCGDAGGLCFLALGCPLLPVHAGEVQCRSLGLKVEVLDAQGKPLQHERGVLACLAPFPAMPSGLHGDSDGQRFQLRYFAQFPNVWSDGEQATLSTQEGVILHGHAAATTDGEIAP